MSQRSVLILHREKSLFTNWHESCVRDRPFNLKGGGGGGLWFFVSFRIFYSDNTRVRIVFFSDFHIRLYDKNSESDYFFFLHQNQNIFFSNIGNQNIFLETPPPPPPPPPFKLNGRSLMLPLLRLTSLR